MKVNDKTLAINKRRFERFAIIDSIKGTPAPRLAYNGMRLLSAYRGLDGFTGGMILLQHRPH